MHFDSSLTRYIVAKMQRKKESRQQCLIHSHRNYTRPNTLLILLYSFLLSFFFVCVVIVNNIEWIYYCKIELMSCSIEFILIGTYICNSFRKLLWFNISHADVVRKIIFLLLLWIKVGWSEMWEEVMKLLEDSNLRKIYITSKF